MEKIKFNSNWNFAHAPAGWGVQPKWSEITLPHDAQIYEPRAAEHKTGSGGAFFKGDSYIYAKTFDAPEEWRDKSVILEFDGVYQWSNVSLNGDLIMKWPYGYSGFLVDISKHLKIGKPNKLEVTVNNSAVPNSRWYSGAGIYRSIWLRIGGSVCVEPWGVQIRTPKACPQTSLVNATVKVKNNTGHRVSAIVRSRVLTPCGSELVKDETTVQVNAESCGKVKNEMEVTSPKLWSVEEPNLYTMKTEILVENEVVDTAETVFGIRDIKFTREGFFLNGVNRKVKGGCVHHDCGLLGSASFERAEERKVELMKASGFDAIRCAHNPPSTAMLEACDRLGMLVIDETFDCWRMGKNPNDYHLFFEDWWERDTRNMILRDFNHPSVVAWSIGNEITERSGISEGYMWAKKQADFVRSMDETRPVNAAVCMLFEQVNIEAAGGGNLLANLLEGKVDEKNDYWGDVTADFCEPLDFVGYNYLFHRYEYDGEKFPNRIIFGAETFSSQQFEYWQATLRNPHVFGDFVWTAIDYLGEAGIGRSEYVAEEDESSPIMGGHPWNQAFCGDIDICGFKRPQSYFRDIMWGVSDVPYIAVRHPEHFGKTPKLSPWGWNPVCDSWSYPGFEGRDITVEVYSDKDEVELIINDKSMGRKPAGVNHRNTASFDVVYEPGTIVAVAYLEGQEAGKTELITAGAPAAIRLSADRSEISKCDDLSYITVEVVDENGNLVKYAGDMINFTITGPGVLQAVGNGNPVNEEDYFGSKHSVHEGRAMAVIRSGCDDGTITLKAESGKLEAAEISIAVK